MDIDNRILIALSIVVLLNILYSSKLEHLDPATLGVAQMYSEGNMSLPRLNVTGDLSVYNDIINSKFYTTTRTNGQFDKNGCAMIDKLNILSNTAIRGDNLDFGTEKSKTSQMITMGLGGSYIRPVPATAHQWDLTHDLTTGNLSIGECYNDPAKPAGSQWICVNKVVLNGKNGEITLNGNVTVNGKLQVNGDLTNTQNAVFASDIKTRGKTRVFVGTDMAVTNTISVGDALLLAGNYNNNWAITHVDKSDDSGELNIVPVKISDSNGFLRYVPNPNKGAVTLIKNYGLTMTGEVHASGHT